ncbi:hypothetical protein FWH13_02970 [Candidatus Saccharibacteria bacterium]|nr:hypothetical protein [Candidatus Saccharibacteria bacterium]
MDENQPKPVFGGGKPAASPSGEGVFNSAPSALKNEVPVNGVFASEKSALAEKPTPEAPNTASPAPTFGQASSAAPKAPKPKGWWKKWAMIGAGAVVGVAVITGGVIFAVHKFSPNGFFLDAMNNLAEADTISVRGDVTVRTSGFFSSGSTRVKFDIDSKANGADFEMGAKLEVSVGEGVNAMNVEAAGDVIYRNGDMYLKADFEGVLESLGMEMPEELEEYNNTWIRVSEEMITEMTEDTTGMDLDMQESAKCLQDAMDNRRARRELVRALNQMVTLERKETRDGVMYLDVVYSTNPNSYVRAMKDFRHAALTNDIVECLVTDERDRREVWKNFDDMIKEMEEDVANGSMTDAMMRDMVEQLPEISLGIDRRTRQFSELHVTIEVGDARVDVYLDMTISKTKPVISAPSDYVDGDRLLEDLMSGGVVWDTAEARDDQRLVDLSRAASAVSRYRGNNRNQLPCFSGTGCTTWEEFADLYLRFDGEEFDDPNGTEYVFVDGGEVTASGARPTGTVAGDGQITVFMDAMCRYALGGMEAGPTSLAGRMALMMKLENGEFVCRNT